ncbi:hypothetical protein CRV15_17100 [Streptomyces clavuligerus]|uniref:Calcium-binding protein n=2 Tax=Streptomyces clavuligerus TaxID=1901 RepID=B5GPV0_STRCL|nr:conserved hypothetical protein [Streptomyces clavuligerus]EFG07352.1 Hypothetical protein SCLAV_2279 [Streptomyces clavuligerus]QCS07185.1 hypothetical protein CRV15_17100 [Streptomyces clavuligerus]QPJ93464.1 hypothetical protein GE265_10950 [Streptomyces clavuligerus]
MRSPPAHTRTCMRFRVSVAVVTGALAATALAAPVATAADSVPALPALSGKGYASKAKSDDVRDGDTRITSVSVNGGKPIVLHATDTKKVTVTFTAKDNRGIAAGDVWLWRGTDPYAAEALILSDGEKASCTNKGTTGTCKANFTFDPWDHTNDLAGGGWRVAIYAEGKDGDGEVRFRYGSTSIQRDSRLTVDAAPEPVKKNANLTVTGALTRANWDVNRYTGYSAQPVKLQYRAKDAKTYTTVKTVTTDSVGKLKTTVKATADGYYRYSFAGTSTTKPVTTAGDFIDVN